jgi:hypothetical protein
MKTVAKIRPACPVLLGLLTLNLAVTPAAATPSTGCVWTIWPAPTPGGSANVVDLAALPGKSAWAVGFTAPLVGGFGTVAMHGENGRWVRVHTPDPDPVSNRLDSVSAVSADDIWAVGSRQSGAVGSSYDAEGAHTFVVHWDGRSWKLVNGPHLSGQLNDVAAEPNGSLWRVGYREVPPTTLIERWDGSSWRVVPSEERPGSDFGALFGVAVGRGSGATWSVDPPRRAGARSRLLSSDRTLLAAPDSAGRRR